MDEIQENDWYSLTKLAEIEPFPWCTSYNCLKNLVQKDKENENILEAVVSGSGKQRRYFIKGEKIIRYFNKWKNHESGQI